MNKIVLIELIIDMLCISLSSCAKAKDAKVVHDNIRYVLKSGRKNNAYIDCLLIKQSDIHDGICESVFSIDSHVATHVHFIREKQVNTEAHNNYDDSKYRLSLRFDNYEDIGIIPLYYKITINNFPSDTKSLIKIQDIMRYYDPFSYVWIPGYNVQYSPYYWKTITADVTLNLSNKTQRKYKLKLRNFCVAYNDEPVGEISI